MNIGVQTRPWGPEYNRSYLDQILTAISAFGYDGFEIGAQHLDIGNPAFLRDLGAAHRLQVVGVHVGGEIYDPESVQAALKNLERIVAFAQSVGASFVPYSGKAKPNKTPAELAHQADSLNRIGRLCRRHDLTFCYHNHDWEIENDCAELQHLCDHTDPDLVSLCLDVGWVYRAGSEPLAVIKRFLHRVGYFHIKDTTATEWREVGHGDLDYRAILPMIQANFDGWLVVEQDETQRKPVESARMSREFLTSVLRYD